LSASLFLEFRPGEPWKGYPNIDPETDPYVTPGSVINNLSINTVREVDHLRDRNSGMFSCGVFRLRAALQPRAEPVHWEMGLLLAHLRVYLLCCGFDGRKAPVWLKRRYLMRCSRYSKNAVVRERC